MINSATFWDKAAAKYASDPIKDMASYTYTLERTRSYLRDSDTVLEIGCGTGSTALLLAQSVGTYHGTDISGEMIKIARNKVSETSLPNLSFEEHPALDGIHAHDGLDAVMAFNLLHLLENIPSTLNAIHAALRPGGLLITKTPCLADSNWKIPTVNPFANNLYTFGSSMSISSITISLASILENEFLKFSIE